MPSLSVLSVGGIGLGLSWRGDEFDIMPVHARFSSESCPVDISVTFHCGDFPKDSEAMDRELLFDSGAVWRLYRQGDGQVLEFRTPLFGTRPYMAGVFDADLARGDVFINRSIYGPGRLMLPKYPLDELLVVSALAQGRGVLLHGCLIDDSGSGLLFVGQSGDGKSTMAGLWEKSGVTEIYSDDRVIVREHEGRFWAYGTPWHGTGRYAAPKRVPLTGIFVLRQAQENRCRELSPVTAVSRLFARSFPTFWNRDGLDFTVSFLERLAGAVPCYELGFTPTEEIVAFVRALHDFG